MGSIVYDYFKTGEIKTAPKTYKIEGIGEDFIPKNYDLSVIDDMIQVEDKESFLMTRDLLTKEGLYSGISSGSAVIGAMKWAQAQGDEMRGKNILVLLPDSGNRYLSKVYNDDWMREAGFLERPSLGTVADLLAARPRASEVVLVKAKEKISTVIELMREKGISQIPVTVPDRRAGGGNSQVRGIVSEGPLLSALYEGRVTASDPIESLIDSAVEFVSPQDPIEKVTRSVTAGKTPLVADSSGELIAIVTKIDLLAYLGGRH